MKICPRCQKTYADDNLNFCLEDGSVLTQATPPPSYGGQAPPTSSQGGRPSQPGSQQQWSTPQPQYAMQPTKKSSKTWIWVLLILFLVVVVCGGGIVGLIIYAGNQAQQVAANIANSSTTSPTFSNKNTSNSSTTGTTSSTRTNVETIDLSQWVREFSIYGSTEYTNGELIMGAKQKGYYYVLAAPDEEDNRTDDADTKVTLRNIDNADSKLGYGLVFHSNPMPLQQDYAFLIDTKKKRYHVVHHTPQKEDSVVTWTSSPAIKGGTEENTLEVHDLTDKIELYINGTMVTTIKNVYGYPNGVPGLYAGDGVKIAFKNLEVRR